MRGASIVFILTLSVLNIHIAQETILDDYREEIVQLAEKDIIQRGFEVILDLEPSTQQDLITLNEVEAPPFMEEERAVIFLEMMKQAGVDSAWIDSEGNAIGLKKGKKRGRRVGFDAHLDTVFPKGTDVKVKIKGDTLFAPGIGDDTRGLALVLAVLKTMNQVEIETRDDVLFIGTVGEEGIGDLRGVKHIFSDEGLDVDSWIAVDGGQIGRVNNKGLGSYRYKVTFEGPGGHSWGAFGLVNPHHALGKAIEIFVKKADQYTASGPKTSYNVGRIGGGTSINSVPFESWMEIDIRSIQASRLDSMENLLEEAVEEAVAYQNSIKRLGGDMSYKIEKIGNRPSGELSSEIPLVQRAMAATAYFGKRPRLTRGSTNSNIPIALGVPAVTIGRGGSGAFGHSLNEWWYNDEGHKAIQLAFLLLVSEAGLAD